MTGASMAKRVAAGDGRVIQLFGVRFRYKIESADAGGSLCVLEVEIPPKTLVKPHTHSREDEYTLVLDGTVGLRVGDRYDEAGPGDYLVKPRGIAHAMWNADSRPAKVVEMLAPGGLEEYFAELAPVLARHEPPAAYYGLAERYGLTILDDWIEDIEQRYGVKL